MTLIHRGTNSSNLRPTLLITALDLENEKWWSNILPELKATCPQVSNGRNEIEFLHGAISYATTPNLTAADFEEELQMGGSISAAGSDVSGAIGAAVKLLVGSDTQPTTFRS